MSDFGNPVPSLGADPVELADWMELEAVGSADGTCSHEELASSLHKGATGDAIDVEAEDDEVDARVDARGEQSARVADDAWAEIERRVAACGGDGGAYPFDVTTGAITLSTDWERSPYVFQMLLSRFGKDAVKGQHPERDFERLSAIACVSYLGGTDKGVLSKRLGSPRDDRTNFVAALKSLCRKLNEGNVNSAAHRIKLEKDSHLDVVAWCPFPDSRGAQLIVFGQCATGQDWERAKLTELNPSGFARKWLSVSWMSEPVRAVFVPHCIPRDKWRNAAIDGGILFDRCRIAGLTRNPPPAIVAQCEPWTTAVVGEFRKAHDA